MTGVDIVGWQNFLRGRGFYFGTSDGHFGPKTKEGTMLFQKAAGLIADGVVGNLTYAEAMRLGFAIVQDTMRAVDGPNWPPVPSKLRPIGSTFDKQQAFGEFSYDPAPLPGNPENIRIRGNWVAENITQIFLPQIVGVRGASSDGKISWHVKGADQIKALFQAWENAGLLRHILTWDGSWAPRFVRGSRTYLSNHAWATAFDINASQNPLGSQPALVGKPGCVRELVELANDCGFYWGGHFSGRPDGMHFELAKIM